MADFIDRETELRELRALAEEGRPTLALLYGRRRVGKTYLLDRAWPDRRTFYYLAADSTGVINRRELLTGLAEAFELSIALEDFPTWRSIFRLIASLASDGLVVILDEFQYLVGDEDDVVSQLVAVWDREVEGLPLLLVLCGSEVGTMAGLQSGASPLYGRINWSTRLHPFDYLDAGAMVPGRAEVERAHLYGVLGGTPRFLSAVREEEAFAEAVKRLVLSPRGEVHLQLSTIVQQERGIRDAGDYQAVLKAVAEGRTGTNEIAQAAGLGDRPHVVRRALEVLEDLRLVRRERNFGASPRTRWRNRIADNAVEFWYRFVHRNRSGLERGEVESVWTASVLPRLEDYMGWSVFEGMAEEAFHRLHPSLGLPSAAEWARWEGQDRNRRAIEIDVVARLENGRMLTGEVKWSARPADWDLHTGLKRDLEDLRNSGQAWAGEALDSAQSAGQIYFCRSGFTDHFQRRAKEEGKILLIDLEAMYDREGMRR